MAIYWILLIAIIFFGIFFCRRKCSKINNIRFLMLSFASCFLVQSCRAYSVGIDTIGYVSIFYRSKDLPFHMYPYSDIEWGYLLLNKLVGYFTDNPQWLLTIVSAIICIGIAYFIYQNSNNPFWPTFLFLCMNYFFTSIVSLRQYIAIAIVINAFQCAKKKKFLWVAILAVAAALFHTSALFGVVCIVVSTLWIPGRKMILASVVMIGTAYAFLPQIMNLILAIFPKYQFYLGRDLFQKETMGEYTFIILIFEIVAVFLLWFSNVKTDEDLLSITMIIIFAIGINLMKTQIPLLWRLGYYPDMFLIIFIPKIIQRVAGKKLFYYFFIFIGGCALYAYFMKTNAAQCIPYIAFWNA